MMPSASKIQGTLRKGAERIKYSALIKSTINEHCLTQEGYYIYKFIQLLLPAHTPHKMLPINSPVHRGEMLKMFTTVEESFTVYGYWIMQSMSFEDIHHLIDRNVYKYIE